MEKISALKRYLNKVPIVGTLFVNESIKYYHENIGFDKEKFLEMSIGPMMDGRKRTCKGRNFQKCVSGLVGWWGLKSLDSLEILIVFFPLYLFTRRCTYSSFKIRNVVHSIFDRIWEEK